jgi:hypothetical protein
MGRGQMQHWDLFTVGHMVVKNALALALDVSAVLLKSRVHLSQEQETTKFSQNNDILIAVSAKQYETGFIIMLAGSVRKFSFFNVCMCLIKFKSG